MNRSFNTFPTRVTLTPLSAQVKSKSTTNVSVEVADEPIIHEAALRDDMPTMGPFFDMLSPDYFNTLGELFEEDNNEFGTSDQQTNQKKESREAGKGFKLKIRTSTKVKPKLLGFVKARAPSMGNWIIEATASTSLEREWVVPRSTVQAENGFLYVPVWNLSSVGVPWRRLRGHITTTLIGDDSTQIVADKEDIGYICTIDKLEEIPNCEDVILEKVQYGIKFSTNDLLQVKK